MSSKLQVRTDAREEDGFVARHGFVAHVDVPLEVRING